MQSMARSLRFDQSDQKYLYSGCSDPICDAKRRQTLKELDVVKSKLKQIQSDCRFDDTNRKMKSFSHINCGPNESYSRTRDMTRNMLTTNDPTLFAQRTSQPGAIAEIETIL